MEIYLSELL